MSENQADLEATSDCTDAVQSQVSDQSEIVRDTFVANDTSENSFTAALSRSDINKDDHTKEANPTETANSISNDVFVNGEQILLPNVEGPMEEIPVMEARLQPSTFNADDTCGPIRNLESTTDVEKIAWLEAELHKAQSLILSFRSGSNTQNGIKETSMSSEKNDSEARSGNVEITTALQLNLEQQMNAKAEAENKVRLLESQILTLEQQLCQQQEEILKNETLHENLQLQMTAKAEAENKARSAYDRVQQLESEKEKNLHDLKLVHEQFVELRETVVEKDRELDRVRSDRDEYERKVDMLTTRLNAVKKKDAVKLNYVDEVEHDLEVAREELEQTKTDLQEALTINASLEQKLLYVERSSKERIDHLESALKEEQKLNIERKIKMKDYVEKKAEELRQVKEENNSLQIDLTQTNHSLVELNNRWKQLHTQWVQAQTCNRELQRDMLRMKKDSEHLHKQGDTLEMKLSRSANETEEHKNKRLAAKQELLSVLHALENERGLTAKLCDKIKFSFTPKLLNQQQVVKELLEELLASLEKLSIRLGKPLPALPSESTNEDGAPYDNHNGVHAKSASALVGEGSIHSEVNPLIEKLEHESQNLSDVISAVAINIDRLHVLVNASGDRTCLTVLSELVSTGTIFRGPALQMERHTLPNPLATIGRSHRYGQVPGNTDNY